MHVLHTVLFSGVVLVASGTRPTPLPTQAGKACAPTVVSTPYEPLSQCAPSPTPDTLAPAGMVLVRGGTFEMGDVMDDHEETDENPLHTVTLSDFYLATHELTFAEYDAFCAATARSKPADQGWGRDNHPVGVSWYEVIAYCNWRSREEGLEKVYAISYDGVSAKWDANGYRLPTEAEWEYAARQGGQKVRFGDGQNTADPARINFDGNWDPTPYSKKGIDRQKTIPVGSLNAPNALGLHDMSGNVWEWCWDYYGAYAATPQTNPRGPDSGVYRVLRGGSWCHFPAYLRTVFRFSDAPGLSSDFLGFRLARSVR